jgi:hemoglobin
MDIATTDDVALLVDRFYGKVRCDALLGPIFNDVAQVDWPAHMATLYSLWRRCSSAPARIAARLSRSMRSCRWRRRTSIAGWSCF